ncbi:ABC transporter ATP-binding protein [Meridianimarinicoccus aquatilis]|uniref:ABC transporter ATP-binding protein n=1 Tax=Meridianimarinicoccus aquatilis TaxID=2552766 RepID=A0A4R6B2D3_9RHOB|nr:ABC transporter ATP-binding protein [Fluviibacterium aquatile]QIE42889.1 ABC transporter ATP-binding protein [Rhodobacteraceae bacterium SC52]TDL90770.1 ABC transporter ATP-binding protein [Fluviibacterium aquatile]
MLETHDLTVRFGGHTAVDAVSCRFHTGELTAIVGPNGAGKTTFFNLVSGQVFPTSGRVTLSGADISRLSPAARTRRGIGRGFQQTNLFPGLTVTENVRLAVQARQRKGGRLLRLAQSDKQMGRETDALLSDVRLERMGRRLAAELSHGEQRMLEVALLMALQPSVYMFDEPTAGMSAEEAPLVLGLIDALRRDASKSILLVEHKLDVIRSLADRIVVLHNGKLVAQGAPDEVMGLKIVQDAYMGQDLVNV